jgi:oxygen-independent coproporphyrinogen-3 oxidase
VSGGGPAPAARLDAAVTEDLLRRYDRQGPRYTSYPTAVEFHGGVGPAEARARLVEAARRPDLPLSLYAHLPFCEARCSFCACTVLITRRNSVAEDYLGFLEREIDLVAGLLGGRRRVRQLHFGGGTPTFLRPAQLRRLHGAFARRFEIEPDAEVAVEVDPRVTTDEQVHLLRELGFSRVSMGVQDFDPAVQEAIRRIQPFDATERLVSLCRRLGYASVNLDLVYGLPRQREEGFARTLEQVLALRPDRVALYSFAMVPWLQRNQRLVDPATLPPPAAKIRLFAIARERFLDAGYRAVGMDHFALPGDDLARAAAEGTLHRNFMGYAPRPAPDLVGFGMSAIGEVAGAFLQNHKRLPRYYDLVAAGEVPTERGRVLDADDERRRAVILDLMCNFRLDARAFEARFGASPAAAFPREFEELRAPDGPAAHGFVRETPAGLEVTEVGTLFVRNLAMVFDRYRREARAGAPVFSRTV